MKISKPIYISLLILLNSVPIYGIAQWGWKSFDLIFLYWLENLMIGGFMIIRILARRYSHPVELVMPLFMAPFFTFHYGMFSFVHGTFIMALFAKGLPEHLSGMNIPEIIIPLIEVRHLLWPLISLLVYQLIDWIRDISERGFGSDGIKELTTAPYRRIVILHITILASGFALGALNEPFTGLLLLIIFKTAMDLYHWNKDEKAASHAEPLILDEKIKNKINAFLDEPKITVNGKDIHYNSYQELRESKHYSLMLSMMRMLGGGKQFKEIESYIAQQVKQRENLKK